MRETFFKKGSKTFWSFKYDKCIECGLTDFKHKGKGLCTSCYFAQTRVKKKYKAITRKSQKKYYNKYKEQEEFMIRRRRATSVYFWKNRDALNLIARARHRIKKGLPCLQIIIRGITRHLPFETLEKPKNTTSKDYEQWKQNDRDFQILRKYYNKPKKRKG